MSKKAERSNASSWWREGVFYQIYPRSFMDADNDGTGDLRGIIEKLDYLNDGTENSLGVDALWLSPIFASPMYDFGYDVSDFTAIDPSFGTMEDFDELLSEAHKRNIRIVLDFVPNHTSHLHEWFKESRSSRDNPKRDWYIWRDAGSYRGRRPNNWQSVFGGPAWEWDEKTEQFYYHHFVPQQPDVNWRNPDLKQAMLDQMRFWLDKGVDGFRLDVINHIYKDDRFRSNPYCLGPRPYDMQRHLYDKDQPEAIGIAKDMRALVDSYGKKGERMLVGEVFIEDPETAVAYYGDGTDGLNICFYFNFCFNSYKARQFRESVRTWERLLPSNAQPTYFLSNHDLPGRHIHRYGALSEQNTQDRARVTAMMLLTLRGTPFLYYGEEIGMRHLHIKKKDIKDPVGIRYWPVPVGRDRCRTPMQWESSAGAGFTASDNPWLPINPNHTAINVAAQKKDPDSLFNFYRRLLWKRRNLPSLLRGGLTILDDAPDRLFCYLRSHENETTLVTLNFSHKKETLSIPDRGGAWEVAVSSHREEGDSAKPGTIIIHPSEATLWACKQ